MMICSCGIILWMVCISQFLFILFLLSTKLSDLDSILKMAEKYCMMNLLNFISDGHSKYAVVASVFNISTSVFCFGELMKDRECRFQNLCYNSHKNEYLFFHGTETRLFGLENAENDPALVDLSSVINHTAQYFTYTDVQSSSYDLNDVEFIDGHNVLFHRFNPENLMHVLHDDLIPVHHTQRKYFPTNEKNVTYLIMDGRPAGPFYDIYTLFLRRIRKKETFTKTLTCFQDVIVGISKATTWYHYGFREPQGPLHKSKFPVSELLYFRRDFTRKLYTERTQWTHQESKYIVLFSRSQTRKILNELPLMMKLTKHYKMAVHIVNLENDLFSDIITLISNAYMLIGVHGAHLITSLFMKPNSILVELFPFGIPSVNYTPYKTLANLLQVRYIPWENNNEKNTVVHKDWSRDYGGINHFPKSVQDDIINTKIIPAHLCCKDGYWLFRIYQDTIVDVENFYAAVDEALNGFENANK